MLPNQDIGCKSQAGRPDGEINQWRLVKRPNKKDRPVLRWKDGPVSVSNVQAFAIGSLVDGERTEHGEVVAGEGADELVFAGGRRGERRLSAFARSQQDSGAQQPGVA